MVAGAVSASQDFNGTPNTNLSRPYATSAGLQHSGTTTETFGTNVAKRV
jgi:hypothetical protein